MSPYYEDDFDALARAVRRLIRQSPFLKVARATAHEKYQKALEGSYAEEQEAAKLDVLDAIEEVILAYEELPLDVRFPLGGSA